MIRQKYVFVNSVIFFQEVASWTPASPLDSILKWAALKLTQCKNKSSQDCLPDSIFTHVE